MNQEVFDHTYQEEVYQIKQGPVVVINDAWEKLGEKERELLTKIISALKISIDSTVIITQPALNLHFFIGKTTRLIYFGNSPTGVSRYEVLESEGLSFLCSETLTALLSNEPARKQLWTGLKKLFSV